MAVKLISNNYMPPNKKTEGHTILYVHITGRKGNEKVKKTFFIVFFMSVLRLTVVTAAGVAVQLFVSSWHNERWMAYAIDIGTALLFCCGCGSGSGYAMCFSSSSFIFLLFPPFQICQRVNLCTMVVLILYFAPSNKMNELKDLPLSSPTTRERKFVLGEKEIRGKKE